jgi:hypothetical protein
MPSPRRFPTLTTEFDDFEKLFEKHILYGLKPSSPFLEITDSIISVGSCFAENIHNSLVKIGLQGSVHFGIAETANSPFSLNKLMEIITLEATPGSAPSKKDLEWADNFVRKINVPEAVQSIKRSKCVIITVGVALASLGFDGYPSNISINNCNLLDQEDNFKLIKHIIYRFRDVNPDINIIITVSPVPLAGSPFSDLNAITLDCISKSYLRSAVDKLMKLRMDRVFYWPSFEAIRWVSGHSSFKFGDSDGNPRHIDPNIIDSITRVFIRHFIVKDT